MVKRQLKIILVISFVILVLLSNFCLAQTESLLNPEPEEPSTPIGLEKGSTCMESGKCELNDFVRVAINVSKIILGVVGSLALLAFVIGGVMFLISAGSSERVTQAKQIILGAVIGLVIVFTSFMIIKFVYEAMGLGWEGKQEFPTVIEKK